MSPAVVERAAVVLDAPGRAGDDLGSAELCVDAGQFRFLLFDAGSGGLDGEVQVGHELVEAGGFGFGDALLVP
jgi:hypothetical protein